ncbi:MAG TPA: radical SAM protein [bacterium (Candidatus Stahlbacteria)]|nr:radical SAM protein [Candidatus Stahlbacteria bacterium]
MLYRKTASLCPVCKKIIPATIFEKEGKVMIKKECKEHGVFEDVYWGNVNLYLRAEKWMVNGEGVKNPKYPIVNGCPFDCGLCDLHKTPTLLANIDITNRCNLQCPICFANANTAGYVYELSYKQVVAMLRLLRENEPKPYAVQFSGGEPTIHPEFLKMVSIARKMGFSQVQVATNGIKLAEKGYAQKLLDAGLHTVYLQSDGIDERQLDLSKSRILTRNIFIDENRREERHLSLRLYTLTEMIEMLREVGLEINSVFGDLTQSDYTIDSKRMVILAEKKIMLSG